MKARLPLLALVAVTALPQPSQALVINFTQIAGDTLLPAQLTAFGTAAQAWENVLTDPVTVNISIGFRDLGTVPGGIILGGATPTEVYASYSAFRTLMALDATSAADATAVANLPASVPGDTIHLTSANARALGFTTPTVAIDATIEFTSNAAITYQYSRNPDGGVNPGAFDFLGVAGHEIGHALGFISNAGAFVEDTTLDLFRFQGTTRSLATGPAFFSIDGGVTDLAPFSDGITYQTSHWADGTPALMAPALSPGNVQPITPLDLKAMDVIGWDIAAVPEPASFAVLAFGLGILAFIRRPRA
ncbi:NF038122 family metalloprotease [Limobrevibacterium gyesilva]|uniref:NF038122 family metalloprotease n=1 Tax=Limobrevibacterium gyesilva TaxID=2991712 RepID=A0AA41YL73_9PROT|nr:NF038122 family metalloprotease [Limobrevibacterium gyesilva]MCW3475904.1 NF038122 family metalloprotease [Limobrevibacterium gyesilva]